MNNNISVLSDKLRLSVQSNNAKHETKAIVAELFDGNNQYNLDYKLTSLLTSIMEEGGEDAAELILTNINQLKVTHSEPYQAQNLAEHIMDTIPNGKTALKLIEWNFELIKKSFVTQYIDVDDNWAFYERSINKLVSDPKYSGWDLNNIIFELVKNSPQNLGKILQSIKTTKQKISLQHLVTYLVENDLSLNQLEESLSIIGKLDSANDVIVHSIVQAYPNNCVTNVFKYISESSTSSYSLDQIINTLAESLKENELPEFYGHLETIFKGKLVSKSTLNTLLGNRSLPIDKLINSKLSEQVYKSFLSEIYWIEKDYIPQSSHYKFNDLLTLLAKDHCFLTLNEEKLQKELINTISKNQGSKSNDQLKIYLLTNLPITDKLFSNNFVGDWYRDCNSHEAMKLLINLERNKNYPFYEYKFLIYIYKNLDSKDAKSFVATRLKNLFTKDKSDFARACEELAQENDNNFCLYFIQKSKKLLKGAGKYDSIHRVKKLAFSKLTLGQRFKVMLSF
jgi:hypothetical protein